MYDSMCCIVLGFCTKSLFNDITMSNYSVQCIVYIVCYAHYVNVIEIIIVP